jgi:hypothetical protein
LFVRDGDDAARRTTTSALFIGIGWEAKAMTGEIDDGKA